MKIYVFLKIYITLLGGTVDVFQQILILGLQSLWCLKAASSLLHHLINKYTASLETG